MYIFIDIPKKMPYVLYFFTKISNRLTLKKYNNNFDIFIICIRKYMLTINIKYVSDTSMYLLFKYPDFVGVGQK